MNIINWDVKNFEKFETKVLHENQSAKEIQITMPKDSVMKEHLAPFDISVQVLKGQIWFKINEESVTLNALDMISVDAKILHSLGANEDSIVRLSLAKNDTAIRLNNILK